MNRAPVVAVLLPVFLAAAVLAGCSFATATPTPGATSIGPVATETALPPTSFGPPPSPTADDSSPVVLDATLLDILPASVDGIALGEDADEGALALSDPALDQIATALDVGVAVDVGNGNLVTAWVVRLRPGTFGAEIYRQWRDSYDEGACAAAGGVVGRAEAQIGGRQAFVTSCVSGLHTYHVWLEAQGILISASSIGEGRFGEKLLGALRLPA